MAIFFQGVKRAILPIKYPIITTWLGIWCNSGQFFFHRPVVNQFLVTWTKVLDNIALFFVKKTIPTILPKVDIQFVSVLGVWQCGS
ncbi:hypothetical protein B0T45_18165 [Chromobacterium haemolyticum]|uniref:Uncharacterized protein n=1 Tax=Chromobacterium haemolyticum TaxID=394935 RepID=A0A1W0CJE2_9NEIS|nr:hypothetical protein B0T45_18165 [Chromobacterium haemolyticum]